MEQGIEQGILKEKIENAIKMIRKGMDFSTIHDITELSFDELTRLKEKIDRGEL